jgi:hypothetical protein
MDLTRRSFLVGLGSVTVGLLFARKLDAVLESLERDLVAEQHAPDQQPSAAEIVVVPSESFRVERIVVPMDIAALFVIEDIRIGRTSQLSGGGSIPAEIFSPEIFSPHMAAVRLDASPAGTEIRFRVRYIGKNPRGARFTAALIGTAVDSNGRRRVLPIDSVYAIVS